MMNIDENQSEHIIFIHGTWSSQKIWNDWEKKIKSTESKIHTSFFAWSGKNRSRIRSDAAKQLAEYIDAQKHSKIHLVGHSHGGTIAALALKHINDTKNISSLTTLATPFPTIFYRNLSSRLATVTSIFSIPAGAAWALIGTLVFSCVIMIPISILLQIAWRLFEAYKKIVSLINSDAPTEVAEVVASGASEASGAPALFFSYSMFLAIIYCLLVPGMTSVVAGKVYRRARTKLLSTVRRVRYETEIHPSNTRTLCLSPSGDEVFSYLNFWSAILDVPYLLMGPYFYILIPILSGSMWALFEAQYPGAILPVGEISDEPLRLTALALFSLLTTTLLYLFLATLGSLGSLMSLTPFGFGTSSPMDRMAVRINALPTPLGWGNVQYQEIDMSELSLSHSQIHRADSTFQTTRKFQSWCAHTPFTNEAVHHKIRRRIAPRIPQSTDIDGDKYQNFVSSPTFRIVFSCYVSFFGTYLITILF
jgi:pimeloyl-ACP methyl ester carboxylesterase